MPDTPASSDPAPDDVPTFRLVYRSRNRIPEPDRKSELGAIFSVSRSGNATRGITGALLTHGDWFVQTLEGEESAVRALYEHIYRDRRHEHILVIYAETVPTRVFARWAMARVGEDDAPDIPLLMNVDKGGISPAAPRRTTPDQDEILDYMRTAIRTPATP